MTRTTAAAALAALLAACAGGRAPRGQAALRPIAAPEARRASPRAATDGGGPIDLERARREGRLLATAPAQPLHARTGEMPEGDPFAWGGDGAALERRGVPSHPRARLALDARDGQGGVTEFLVDTGSSASALSASAPAARAARIWPEGDRTSKRGTTVWHATLPVLDLGGLAGRDAPILLHERGASRVAGGNLFGMTLLSGLALDHEAEGDVWRLVPGRRAERAGGSARMAAPGLPVVPVLDDRGERSWALIDTGTWVSMVEAGRRGGRFRLVDASSRTLLDLAPAATAPWKDLQAGPYHVTVWIGLDALEGRTWTMDFATGAWSFAPVRAAGTPR